MKKKPNKIYFGDNYPILEDIQDESVDLIYIDPPFNTGKKQRLSSIKTYRSKYGDRIGFKNESYKTIKIGTKDFPDNFDDYIQSFIWPRMREAYRILAPDGTLYFHIDYREVHYCKILLDIIFEDPKCFLNEIIWAYDYGAKPKNRWPPKHDNILVYVKDRSNYQFYIGDDERIPYLAEGLVSKDKRELGKLPTDTWWHSIVGTNSRERTGYPTQKPRGLIDRIIKTSSMENDTVMDFFAGSGTVGESCLEHNRKFIMIDDNPTAMEVMAIRFKGVSSIEWIGFDPNIVT